MRIFRRLSPGLKSISKESILTIGVFDGVHLGHQKILKAILAKAGQHNLRSGVMTFRPHPDRILNGKGLKLIQTEKQKLSFFETLGIDYCLILSLERDLASLSGQEFAQKILKQGLSIKEVIVGQNFRFGHRRHCGVKELKACGRKYHFRVSVIKPVRKANCRVSSSLIRHWLEKGQVDKAVELLGRPYEISGKIVKGQGIGRKLGFPTINLKTENEILPSGVYLSLAAIKNRIIPSVTNIGFQPTFGRQRSAVETHLLGLKGQFYNQPASIYLLKKLRPEKNFSSALELQKQIVKDVEQARQYFQIGSQARLDLLTFNLF
jgi:riboflavin kinase/FMN adenylyltransferase